MAVRSTWKGYLKVSLVNIPIRVFPATESAATLSFNQLHAECQTRIQQKRWCPKCDREVPQSEIAKGYEFAKGRYVVMQEDDFAKVSTPSTRIINLEQFTDESAIDPMYVDRAYYLAPDGQVAADAYAVMREGMKGKVGIGKVALYGREYLVAIKVQQHGLVMYTLHHAAEIRTIDQIEELETVPRTVKPQELKLAKQVVDMFDGELDLKDYKDEYKEELRKIIDARVAGEEYVAAEVEEPPTNVVDLMAALAQEPRRGQRRQEEARQGRAADQEGRGEGRAQAQARLITSANTGRGARMRPARVPPVGQRDQPEASRLARVPSRRVADPGRRREPHERQDHDHPQVVGQRRPVVGPEERARRTGRWARPARAAASWFRARYV